MFSLVLILVDLPLGTRFCFGVMILPLFPIWIFFTRSRLRQEHLPLSISCRIDEVGMISCFVMLPTDPSKPNLKGLCPADICFSTMQAYQLSLYLTLDKVVTF